MTKISWKFAEHGKNVWEWLKMNGFGGQYVKVTEDDGKCWKQLQEAVNGCKWM